MKYSVVEGITVAICCLALTHCGGQDTRRVLIASGDAVRILSAASGTSCPDGWNGANFDDSHWSQVQLPFDWSTGACMRARFDAGTELSRYRWLKIALGVESQAHLTLAKAIGFKQDPTGAIDWTTQDGESDTVKPTDVAKSYTLDLLLFPDLLQARQNVLALQIAHSAIPVSLTAELDIDNAVADPFVHAVKGPYMVRPTAGAARVVWETSSSAPSWVVVDNQRLDGGWAVHHDVAVTGLAAGTTHPVYVESAEASALPPDCATAMIDNFAMHRSPLADGVSNPFEQLIQRRDLCQQLAAAIHSHPSQLRSAGSNATVRLVVLGDTRADANTTGAILAAAASEAPDLIVHTGDLVSEAVEPNWKALFDHAQPLLTTGPIAAVKGERDVAFGIDRFGQLFSVAPTGNLGHVYSVDQGAVHVAVLDSNSDLTAAAAWLDDDLGKAELAGARHLFVALHWGPWSAGPQGGNAIAAEAIAPVARRHHVGAILSGHDNIYEHGVVDGLNYFVTGGAGDATDTPHAIASTLMASATPHYLLIVVSATGTRVQAKDVRGKLLDDVALQNP